MVKKDNRNLYAGVISEFDFDIGSRKTIINESKKIRSVESFNKRCMMNCKSRDRIR